MKAILYKDGIEIRRVNDYAKVDVNMQLNPNLPANFEWKLLYENPKPSILEIERLVRTEEDYNSPHPDYPHLKRVDVIYTKERKSDAEIIEMIENAENNANEQLINNKDRLKVMVLYMAIVHRKLNGDPINAKMQSILDKGDAYAIKLWQNDTNLNNKLADLTNVEIDTGWVV